MGSNVSVACWVSLPCTTAEQMVVWSVWVVAGCKLPALPTGKMMHASHHQAHVVYHQWVIAATPVPVHRTQSNRANRDDEG